MAAGDLIDLPDEAIDEILCRLPINDAVRTSVLSRRWRHRWRSIPDLNLNVLRIDPLVVTHILRQHSGSLRLFMATCDQIVDDFGVIHNPSAVRSWIETLAATSASTLRVLDITDDLQTHYEFQLLALSRCFPHLTQLRLSFCHLELLPADDFSPFPSLKILDLDCFNLNLQRSHANLLSLYVPPCPSLERLSLLDAADMPFSCDLCWIARNFPRLRHLTIDSYFLRCNPLPAPEFISTPVFPSLLTLRLKAFYFDEEFPVFIPACPALETLIVIPMPPPQCYSERYVMLCACNFPHLLRLQLWNCSLELLRPSSVSGFVYPEKAGLERDESPVQLSKLLSGSPLLEELLLVDPFALDSSVDECMNIAGMNLQHLLIHNYGLFNNFTITAAPVLKKASLSIDIQGYPSSSTGEASGGGNFMKIFGAMHSIENLHLGHRTMKVQWKSSNMFPYLNLLC